MAVQRTKGSEMLSTMENYALARFLHGYKHGTVVGASNLATVQKLGDRAFAATLMPATYSANTYDTAAALIPSLPLGDPRF